MNGLIGIFIFIKEGLRKGAAISDIFSSRGTMPSPMSVMKMPGRIMMDASDFIMVVAVGMMIDDIDD